MHVYRISVVAFVILVCGANARAQFGGGGGPEIPSRIPSQQMPSDEALFKLATLCNDDRETRTLSELLAQLREDTLLSVTVDNTALRPEWMDPDSIEIQGKWKGVAWADVLDNALADESLDYLVLNRTVCITTQEKARERYFVVIYNVSDLITAGHGTSELQTMLEELPGCAWDCDEPGSGRISLCRDLMVISQTQRTHTLIEDILKQLRKGEIGRDERLFTVTYRFMTPGEPKGASSPSVKPQNVEAELKSDEKPSEAAPLAEARPEGDKKVEPDFAESIAEALLSTVVPEPWDDKGGEGTIRSVPGAIIVRQTPEVHRQLRKVLEPFLPMSSGFHHLPYSPVP